MNYIGSKLSLLDFIEHSIDEIVGKNSDYTFCDMFAGTSAVGVRFKQKGCRIIANDFQYYAYVLNRHYIKNTKDLKFKKLHSVISTLKKAQDKKQAVCDYLQNLQGVKGFVYENFCPNENGGGRLYFTAENGQRCDVIREQIEIWHAEKLIIDDEYFFLLASLLESIDKSANTASVYSAYLKKFKKSAQKPFLLTPAKLYASLKKHEVFNEDANVLIRRIKPDVLYLDPPYNMRQYCPNYHVLETIARYDSPKLIGKTGIRNYANQRSSYCLLSQVKRAFFDLIKNAKAKYIFLSYNNEGLLTADDIKQALSQKGEYGLFKQDYNRFKADKARGYSADKTIEYLHYAVCG
jgi:adenine-specific DNA-methyltransferase